MMIRWIDLMLSNQIVRANSGITKIMKIG